MTEQIQKSIDIEVEKRLTEKLLLFNKRLTSKYRIFTFYGVADGTPLTGIANLNDFIGRDIIIKSIRFIPYANGDTIDFLFFDGVTTTTETIINNTRLVRIFDDFVAASLIRYTINGNEIIFKSGTTSGYPIDLFVDNINYQFPEKFQTLEISINARINSDLAGTLVAPNIKVVTECYLI